MLYKSTMKRFLIPVFLCALVGLSPLAGCASYSGMKRMDNFNDTAKSYKKMVFWSEFNAALSFREPGADSNAPTDLEDLKTVKVTSYKVRRLKAAADQTQVQQIVDIDYYRMDDMTVRTLEDQQLWVYDAAAQRWYLRSGLPDFK